MFSPDPTGEPPPHCPEVSIKQELRIGKPVANKILKRRSAPSEFRKMQIKATMRYYFFTHTRARTKNKQ